MENCFNDFITAAKNVSNKSKDVKINYDVLDEQIKKFNKSDIINWLDSNPFNILDNDLDKIIDALLFLHTIGDYCFWGIPKWTINTGNKELDGYNAMMYLVCKHIKNHDSFNMNFNEFKNFLKANVEIPLLEDRYNNLVVMNKFLGKEKFSDLIREINSDVELFNYIINNFKYFEDKSVYKSDIVYFYKRAQLFVSDILQIRSRKTNTVFKCNNLIGCADYKLPQVLRCYGILHFSSSLENMVDNEIEILQDSDMELEIRANTLVVIDYISKKLGVPRMDINNYIWLLGQDKNKMNKPYHKTLTSNY